MSRDVQDAEEAAEGADQQPDGGEEDRGLQLEPYLSAKLLSSPLLTHSCKESQPTPPRYERPRRHFCMASVSSTVERCYGSAAFSLRYTRVVIKMDYQKTRLLRALCFNLVWKTCNY